jgi:hypothetical protein
LFSLVKTLELSVTHGFPSIKEGHEVSSVKCHKEREEGKEEIAGCVIYYTDQPPEKPCVLEEALNLHLKKKIYITAKNDRLEWDGITEKK